MATKWTLLGQKNGSGDSTGDGIVNVNPTGNDGPFNVTIDNYHNLDLTLEHSTADGGTIIVGEGNGNDGNLGINSNGVAVSLSVNVGGTLVFDSKQLSYTTFNDTTNLTGPFTDITNGGLPVNGQCIALLNNNSGGTLTISTTGVGNFAGVKIDRSADVEIPHPGFCLITLVRMQNALVATISGLS